MITGRPFSIATIGVTPPWSGKGTVYNSHPDSLNIRPTVSSFSIRLFISSFSSSAVKMTTLPLFTIVASMAVSMPILPYAIFIPKSKVKRPLPVSPDAAKIPATHLGNVDSNKYS